MKINTQKLAKLVVCILLCEVCGAVGSIFTVPQITTWYASLVKPFFSPPNWVFAPVWTTLFLLMGVSLYIILDNDKKNLKDKKRISLYIFGIQFLLNIAWSYLFFGLKNPLLGFVDIVALWCFIAATMYSFAKINKKAAYLLIPYLLWVSFAGLLNFFIMILN